MYMKIVKSVLVPDDVKIDKPMINVLVKPETCKHGDWCRLFEAIIIHQIKFTHTETH